MEIYKPQELIDYEYTDPADPFGDTSKDYPQMMYPVDDSLGACASMLHGTSALTNMSASGISARASHHHK